MKVVGRLFLFAILVHLLVACGGSAAIGTPVTDEPASTESANTEFPDVSTPVPEPQSIAQQLASIDAALKQAVGGKVAYNAPPAEMQLQETVTIELVVSLSLSEEQLIHQLSEPGNAQSEGIVEITPEMKAEIIAPADAFSVQSIHADPIQLIGTTETTKWAWHVTAMKQGTQPLTIVLYRLVVVNEEEHWREVAAYETDVKVNTTVLHRLQAIVGKWMTAAFIALAAIAFFFGRHIQARSRSEQKNSDVSGKKMRGHIFISYRRSDSADITGRIYDRLVEEFGREPIFKDVDSIPLGTDFREYLDRKVSECRVFLAIIGENWVNARDDTGKSRLEDSSDFVRIEIESALEKGFPVIPLLVRGAQMPREDELPESLKRLVFQNGIQIRPDPDFHRDMNRLISVLETYMESGQSGSS